MIREPEQDPELDLESEDAGDRTGKPSTVAEHLVPAGDLEFPPDTIIYEPIPVAPSKDEIENDLRSEVEVEAETATPEVTDTEAALVPLSSERLRSVLESLLFIADRPLTLSRILEILEETASPDKSSGPPLYKTQEVQAALNQLATELRAQGRGVELSEVAGGFQLRTAPSNAPWVTRLLKQKPVRLSRAQTETLSIIAYRQPITRPEIDEIRGVDSGGALKTLLERNFIRVLGKKEEAGRPLLYGTTKDFLEFFNLRDLKDLPTLRQYYELTDEHKAKVRAEHGELPPPIAQPPAEGQAAEVQDFALGLAEGLAPPAAEPVAPAEPEAPTGPPPISRVEILDQQLADDAEALKKIDELINAVPMELTRPPGETPAEPDPNVPPAPEGEARRPPGRPGRPRKDAAAATAGPQLEISLENASNNDEAAHPAPADFEASGDDEDLLDADDASDEPDVPDEEL